MAETMSGFMNSRSSSSCATTCMARLATGTSKDLSPHRERDAQSVFGDPPYPLSSTGSFRPPRGRSCIGRRDENLGRRTLAPGRRLPRMAADADVISASPAAVSWRARGAAVLRHSAFRYLVIGGVSAAADFGLLFALHGWLRLWLPAATLIAVVTAFVLNFMLNRVWSFGSTAPIVRQFSRYFLLGCGNWLLTVGMVAALNWFGLNYLVAKTGTLVLASRINYLAYRLWVFDDTL